jgi:hypothetical protein
MVCIGANPPTPHPSGFPEPTLCPDRLAHQPLPSERSDRTITTSAFSSMQQSVNMPPLCEFGEMG